MPSLTLPVMASPATLAENSSVIVIGWVMSTVKAMSSPLTRPLAMAVVPASPDMVPLSAPPSAASARLAWRVPSGVSMAMVQLPSTDMICFSFIVASARGACQELLELDDSAAVAAFHQQPLPLANLDCEGDPAAIDGDHLGRSNDGPARQRRSEMVDLDPRADRHLPRLAIAKDGTVRGVLEISHEKGRSHHLDAGVACGCRRV